jgi:hypothetical protein
MFYFSQPTTQWVGLTGTNPGSGLCTPDLVMIDDGGGDIGVTGTSNGTVTFDGTTYNTFPAANCTIVVNRRRQPDFTFFSTDSTFSGSVYLLSGLALKTIGGGAGTGSAGFPGVSVGNAVVGKGSSRTNYVSVTMKDHGASTTKTTYDFWVMVQNSGGDVGLIDPMITNDA